MENHATETPLSPRFEAPAVRGRFATPWGDGGLAVRDGALVEVVMPCPGEELPEEFAAADVNAPADAAHPGPDAAVLARWRQELEEYFADPVSAHRRWTGRESLLAELGLTPFRAAVYRALCEVPPGETVSYGELATLAGRPGAARAVGTAMAENPLPLVVPCHRVVRGDGSLGRYGRCDAFKEQLLRLEGAPLPLPGAGRQE